MSRDAAPREDLHQTSLTHQLGDPLAAEAQTMSELQLRPDTRRAMGVSALGSGCLLAGRAAGPARQLRGPLYGAGLGIPATKRSTR